MKEKEMKSQYADTDSLLAKAKLVIDEKSNTK
jgi:hypothetical protein